MRVLDIGCGSGINAARTGPYYHRLTIRCGDEEQLSTLQQSQVFNNNMKINAHAFTPDQLEAFLYDSSVITDAWSGVRVITDDMFENVAGIDQDTLTEIVTAEYHKGRHPGIRAQGQMLHFVGRKKLS